MADRFDPGSRGANGRGAGLGAHLRGRPGAGAIRLPGQPQAPLDAVRHVHGLVNAPGHTEVVDADLSSYFDEIPHAELLKSLSRRISDRHLLKLIKMWLEARGRGDRQAGLPSSPHDPATRTRARGSPSRISPVPVARESLYASALSAVGRLWDTNAGWKAVIVNYADDLVICCRGDADEAMATMRTMMSKLKLTDQ